MLDNGLLNEFSNHHLKIIIKNRAQGLPPQYAEVFLHKLREIYSTYLSVFPTQCAKLDLLWDLRKANAITFENTIRVTDILISDMYQRFDETYKPPKLFISHATADSMIVKKFVSLLERIGITSGHLFCSSIDGYDVPQGSGDIYDYLRTEMSNDSLFVIMMLSKNYYDSKVCLNEMGAAWIKQAAHQVILLPGFDYPKIMGVIRPTEMCFKLDDIIHRSYDMNELKERILKHLGLPTIDSTQWERKRDDFFSEIDTQTKV
jgi:hypothetical protein